MKKNKAITLFSICNNQGIPLFYWKKIQKSNLFIAYSGKNYKTFLMGHYYKNLRIMENIHKYCAYNGKYL